MTKMLQPACDIHQIRFSFHTHLFGLFKGFSFCSYEVAVVPISGPTLSYEEDDDDDLIIIFNSN